MLRDVVKPRAEFAAGRLNELLNAQAVLFKTLKPSSVPSVSGVYLITATLDGIEHAYYVGRSKNLRNRLYTQHLMGPLTSARLKKYLIASGECSDPASAKQFLRDFCAVRWIEQDAFRERGAIEGYATALLFPRHGIYEEH